MDRIILPKDVESIISRLEEKGYQAYAVGGCVRDSVLSRQPKDWDITTDARPEEVKALFLRCVDTGIRHGTVTVMLGKNGYEVTTFRIDGNYSDGRHPDSVRFTPKLSEDLLRRDFTINAMAYSSRTGIVDLYGGIPDLKRKLIRAVGNPEERFTEDALRILRMVRFCAQLDFRVEDRTFEAAKKLSGNLTKVSAERIREEFMKTLMSKKPERLVLLEEIGALALFFPELSEAVQKAPDNVFRSVSDFPEDAFLRLSELFDIIRREKGLLPQEAAVLADRRLRELKFDNHTRETAVFLMRFSDEKLPTDREALRFLVSRTGKEKFPLLLSFRELHEDPGTDFAAVGRAFDEILKRNECTSVAELEITGSDLIRAGMKPGKALGETLERLLKKVLRDPSLNEKETLLKLV